MTTWYTTDEACARLGVKPATLYAYVSRGLVERAVADDGRRSLFARTEIDALARAGRRPAERQGAVSATLESALTTFRGDDFFYRGHRVVDLADEASFEDVAELLWTGSLPERRHQPWVVTDDDGAVIPPLATLTDRMHWAVVAAGAANPNRHDLSPAACADAARRMITRVARAVARGPLPSKPVPIARLLAGPRASKSMVLLFDRAMVALADHELATCALAARVAASTRADVSNVVLSGLGALAGPLHGTVSARVVDLLERADDMGPAAAIDDWLRWQERIPGLGHQVYKVVDPRFEMVMAILPTVASRPRMKTVSAVTDLLADRFPLPLNIDLALGAMSYACALPRETGEMIFSVARMAGLVAHGMEEYNEKPLRFRARALLQQADALATLGQRSFSKGAKTAEKAPGTRTTRR